MESYTCPTPSGRPGGTTSVPGGVEAELTSGRGPTGVAAAAIYIASGLYNMRKTQKQIAMTVGVTEGTIRNRYKELAENLAISVQA